MAEAEGAKEDKKNGSKVFVFTAPRFEVNDSAVQKQAQLKRKHFSLKVSHFEVDLSSSNPTSKSSIKSPRITDKGKFSSGSTEDTESFSELNLNYEFKEIQNSVIAYLEDTFSEKSRHVSKGFNTNTEDIKSVDSITPVQMLTRTSAQQEYAFSLEQSQKLFDKMQGFVEMSLGESASNKSQSQLNSTESFSLREGTQSLSNSSHESFITQASSCLFTNLSNCLQHLSIVNIFVVVLQVNPIKEIKIKSGINCGQYVKVSSILVGDPSKEYFKLTFWRKAAEWVTSLNTGDVVVVKKLKIEKWNQEFYGQSSFATTLVNLQRVGAYRVPAQWLTIVSLAEAKSLLKWLKCKHPYLVTREATTCEVVEWKTLAQFVPNTLVHYRGKIVKVMTYANMRGKYEFEKRKINKIVAVAIDEESSEEVPICLWGSQAEWRYDLKSKIGHVWSFTFLRVECNTLHGQLCLHTTLQSTKFRHEETSLLVAPTSAITQDKAHSTYSSISELLTANLNGKVIISAGVTKIMNTATVNSERTIDKASDFTTVHRFFRDLVYLGCRLCLRALKQDHNSIYMHCSHCIQHSSWYRFGVMYCFTPCMVYITDKSASIVAMSCHESTSKFLKEIRPGDVLEEPGSNSGDATGHASHAQHD